MLDLTDSEIINIAQHAATECVRQHVGIDRVAYLLQGYEYALLHAESRPLPSEADALTMARLIEPSNEGRYRTTPVTFRNGGYAARPGVVSSATRRLFDFLEEGAFTGISSAPEKFTENYLSIHPLTDGNGRTAFVLHNWVSGTLRNPQPLPEFDW